MINWDAYWDKLQENLNKVEAELTSPLVVPADLKQAINLLFKAINETMNKVANAIKITPHTKQWWTRELSAICKERNRASRLHFKWQGYHEHASHEAFKNINKSFAKSIEQAKAEHWKEWIEHVSGDDIWTIHRYMKDNPMDYGCTRPEETQWDLHLNQQRES